jgi:dihydrofolate reductase
MHVSLDGFAAGPTGELEWAIVNDDMYPDVAASLTNVDTALYGRVTFQMMESYWPNVPADPASTANERHHADWYENVQKVVFSRTLQGVTGKNRHLVKGDIADAVAQLKREPGGDMMIFGSPSIVHALARHGLVDEYRIMVNSVLLGSGTPLFERAEARTDLELVDSRIFDTGVVRLHYRTRTDGGNR